MRSLFVVLSTVILAAFAVFGGAGCSSDDEGPAAPGSGQSGFSGGIVTVSFDPEYLDITWTLTKPNGDSVQGRGDNFFDGQAIGHYQVSWPAVPGWDAPVPNPGGRELVKGGVLQFVGTYTPQPGTLHIMTDPVGVPVPWTLIQPGPIYLSGQGDLTLVDLGPGTYRLVWEDLEGWTTPDPMVAELTSIQGILFEGLYDQVVNSFFIRPVPSEIEASWTITGPGDFSESGQGAGTVNYSEAGDYTLSWDEVTGFMVPDSQLFSVLSNAAYQWTAAYEPLLGTIAIEGTRGGAALNWALSSDDGFYLSGAGDKNLTGLLAGHYSISWLEMDGWSSPEDASQVLDPGASLTFGQSHLPALSIIPQPAGLDAPWLVSGPDGFEETGQGAAKLTGLALGQYSLTWEDLSGWTVPGVQTGTLSQDQGVVISGLFTQAAQSIFVRPEPVGIAAPWRVLGPNGFDEEGVGQMVLTVAAEDFGQYELTWGAVEGWFTPKVMVMSVTSEERSVFASRYISALPMVPVSLGTYNMGSAGNEGCRSSSETQHLVELTNNYSIQATEVTNAQYFELAQWAIDNGYATLGSDVLLDALDNSTVVLLDMGHGNTEIFIEDGQLACRNLDHPVKEVTWYGAAAYCDWLSLHRGLPRAYYHGNWLCNGYSPSGALGFRLPTEAEWERAARAGTSSAYCNGSISGEGGRCRAPNLGLVGWWGGNAGAWTQPVAQLAPNGLGIYDMHGNVAEWCQDWSVVNYYAISPDTDPSGPSYSEYKVVRGGFFFSPVEDCRSAARDEGLPGSASYKVGFRVVRSRP